MKQLKKTILTLVALLAVTTGAWADEITVTWSSGDTYENNNSKDGVTLSGDIVRYYDSEWQLAYEEEKGTFTTELGNFTNIEINGGWIDGFRGEGWSGRTWTGNAAAVPFNGYMTDAFGEKPWTITFTIEPASSEPEPEPGAASAVEVDWNKASKTGTFDMPGGNVTLEPEYYPQAALAAAPTAINDVPATTDGAIVKAGTVANIGSTTTAQGTVMYYVSTTALDDAALLALAADQWTADVPTAESFTAAGTAYVYYYVRGNDGDNDDEIFSDGDILSANALTVNIAAAPTYAVTFADDLAEPTQWTASPAADVKKGQTVTVTYTGTKKVLGVKAEKKAAAVPKAAKDATAEDVGKLIGADGNIYDDAGAATAANTTAVAKIAYVGSDAETSTTYNHGLALALSDVSGTQTWCSQTSSTCLTTQYSSDSDAKADMAGLANTDALVGHGSHTHNAASAARNYNSGTNPTGTSAWFLPSAGQWDKMATAAGGYVTLKTNAGLQSGRYWSSSESSAVRAWNFHSDDGEWDNGYKGADFLVRACLAF